MAEQSIDGAMTAAGDVPHPLHAYATALLKRVGATQTRLNNKQLRPAQAVSQGAAWISTAATTWAGEFTPGAATYVASSLSLRVIQGEFLNKYQEIYARAIREYRADSRGDLYDRAGIG